MKKMVVFLMFVSAFVPAFADIESDTESADCTESVLETTSGTSNLQASWQANTLNLEWYDYDGKMTVQDGAKTCTYDGGITVPSTNPTRTGYTFAGWKIKTCDLNTWDNGSYVGLGFYNLSKDGKSNNNKYSLYTPGQWAVEFDNGVVKGVSLCSSSGGSYAVAGIPDINSESFNCWCRVTDLNGVKCSASMYSWVFHDSYSPPITYYCHYHCAHFCAESIRDDKIFRSALFGQNE